MTDLSNLSNDLAKVVATVGQNVVQVEGRRGGAASGLLWTEEGLIVTANHALTRDEDIIVGLGNGEQAKATLVGRDPTTDLALLRVETKLKASLEWVGSDGLRVGQLVLALGRPGKTVRAALGVISALGEGWRTSAGGKIDRYLQADVSAYPGFSGGPLVTVDGGIAGINTSGLLRSTMITVPTATVKPVVDELLKRGRISRGYLGVGVQPVRLPAETAKQAGQETGLLIISVESGGPGEQAGLVLGDTIVTVGGKSVRHWNDLLVALGKEQIGVSVAVRIVRAGKLQELKATIGERP